MKTRFIIFALSGIAMCAVIFYFTTGRKPPSSAEIARAPAAEPLSLPAPVAEPELETISRENPRLGKPKKLRFRSKLSGVGRAPAMAIPEAIPEAKPEESAQSPHAQEKVNSPNLSRDFWIWIGGGANYTSYSQTVAGFSDVAYGKIKTLTKMARAGFFATEHLGLDLSYTDIPGEVSSSPTISVANGSYDWRTMGAEALYRPRESSPWLFHLGVQAHEMPFIVPLSANTISVSEVNVTSAIVGVEYRKQRKKVRLEYSLFYSFPVSGSADLVSDFELKPKMAAAGSIGASYELRPNTLMGIQWTNRYQSNSFSYKNRSGTSFSGKQNVFSSSFELRLGLEF